MHDPNHKHENSKWHQLIGIVVAGALVGALLFTLIGMAFFMSFDDTTMIFENGTNRSRNVTATIIEIEHDSRERVHQFVLPASGTKVLEVEHGVKRVRYVVDGSSRELDFDQWNSEDVQLTLQEDGSFTR